MFSRRRLGLLVAFTLGIGGGVSAASGPVPVVQPRLSGPADVLSVMSYNVHGLPWPIARRGDAFDRIAQRLRDLRAAGQQPHVVVLQEAFTPAAKAIGAAAGYRYVRFGPDAATAPATSGRDPVLAQDVSHLRGEGDGKWLDSGLVVMSDYPIVASRQIAYPTCAGFDCLANKGALAVRIAVPGVTEPVYVVATHLNAKKAAGVARARTNRAFEHQMGILDAFIRRVVPQDAALFVAGDFNVGQSRERKAVAARMAERASVRPAFAACERSGSCAVADGVEARAAVRRNKDWLLYRPGAAIGVTPLQFRAPVARDRDGTLLSDHVAVAAAYRLRAVATAG